MRRKLFSPHVATVLVVSALCAVLSTSVHAKSRSADLRWSDGSDLNNQAIEALHVLREAEDHGLPAERYAVQRLTQLAGSLDRGHNKQLFNELLTAAIETYSIDLLQGRPSSAFKDKRDPRHKRTSGDTVSSQLQNAVLKGLHRAAASNRLEKFIRSIEPNHPDYEAVQGALKHYREIAARGGWPRVLVSKHRSALEAGVSDPAVPALRARLAATDMPARSLSSISTSDSHSEIFDHALRQRVIAFQTRHGLKADGVVGKSTLAALNVTVEQRVSQLELNLDRWRLLPKVMPANHIWVNVPQYKLKLQLDREEVLDMRVVVGKRKSPTPMMHDRLDHLVFSPYWHLPQKIAIQEVLPKVKADPGYLQAKRFEVLEGKRVIDPDTIDWQAVTPANMRYRIRQKPGKGNSLGDVKFIFPNSYAVYLHDTDAKDLFDNSMRALSHGCVRLEDPAALASALLDWDQGWKPEKVSRAMARGKQKYVKLNQQVPVYLVYFTATVKDGTVQFHQDIYGHDARQKAKLKRSANTQVAQILARHNTLAQDSGKSAALQPAAVPSALLLSNYVPGAQQ